MERAIVTEVQACLRGERTLFTYFPDQYAVYLVRRMMAGRDKVSISEIRMSRKASLLYRPVLKKMIEGCGDGYIYQRMLDNYWHEYSEPYVLTLGEWGDEKDWTWDQISRPGCNLVLQLNVSNKWAQSIQRTLKESPNSYFDCGHPISETRSMTLAWARLDIDFETDEVLIEELQSDSIRDLANLNQRAKTALKQGRKTVFSYGKPLKAQGVFDGTEAFLEKFRRVWKETMLTATINFVFEELGMQHLYYHTFETGNRMKNLEHSYPPRSLYTELPKKFCFTSRNQAPAFLQRDKKIRRKLKKLGGGSWFYMAA